jgi:hypothetical protein
VTAWQKQIRDKQAAECAANDPYDQVKREAGASLSHAIVREISRDQASSVILKYEWLGTLGNGKAKYFGLFFKHPTSGVEYLGGVACFGSTAGSNVAKSICGPENAHLVCTLTRGAKVNWAHKH